MIVLKFTVISLHHAEGDISSAGVVIEKGDDGRFYLVAPHIEDPDEQGRHHFDVQFDPLLNFTTSFASCDHYILPILCFAENILFRHPYDIIIRCLGFKVW